jgi:hypothetical protein
MISRHLIVRTCLSTALGFVVCLAYGEENDQSYFEREVRQILKTHCWHCHGEEPELQGGLDLRLVRTMHGGGDSGAAIVAGDSQASLLWQRIAAGDMPPGDKHLADHEITAIQRWLDQGALTLRPEPENLVDGEYWTEEERAHWSLQPVQRPAVPQVGSRGQQELRNPIDAFILDKLEAAGLQFSGRADRATLLRRLSFDLHGLPPTEAQLEDFSRDLSPDAYDRLVDSLLESPQFGERWGRHWLDTAGYADSDGYNENDRERAWVYRYRDYVIRAFNDDKPYDQFVIEQLAGDELLTPPYQDLTPTAIDSLVATGFLRLAPDGTGQGEAEPMLARNDHIAETIKIATSSLIGMTVGCAQCHNHRYDPISQADYFRIRSLFEPALDTNQWRVRSARFVSTWDEQQRQLAAQVDAELAEIEGRRVAELDTLVQQVFEQEVEKLPEEKRELAKLARTTAADQRDSEQLAILKEYPSLNVDRGSVYLYEPARMNEFNKKYETLVSETRAKRPAESFIDAFTEVPGQIPATHLFFRGDFNQPREVIVPGELSVLPRRASIPLDDTNLPTTGRRLAYAKHLTSGQHPLLGRVIVNRIWMHYFGRGIVATPGDFGVLGERPSHPELLDWLADELVRANWSLKHIHRLILTSNTYQQRSQRSSLAEQVDPENRLLGRMSVRRLEAEVIRDAMIAVTGQLHSVMYGPGEVVNPDDVGQVIIGQATRDGNGILVAKHEEGPAQYRRSIYIQVRRSMPLGVLEPFDLASLNPNCERRSSSTVAPQALLMMNNRQTVLLAERFAQRLLRDHPHVIVDQVSQGWRLALGRQPSPEELAASVKFVTSSREEIAAIAERAAELDPQVAALALFCQALMSSNPFLYVD